MRNKTVVIIGDVIIDEVVQLRPTVSSSVEDVPTYNQVSRKRLAGGAANVAKNCVRLGATVCLLHCGPAMTFNDDGLTNEEQLRVHQVWIGRGSVVTKQRFYADDKKLFKVNVTVDRPDIETEDITHAVDDVLMKFPTEVVLACDNGHGTISSDASRALVELCKRRQKRLYVDAQLSQSRPNFDAYSGAVSIFLNSVEHRAISKDCLETFETYHLKLGDDGSCYYDGRSTHRHNGFNVDVIDTVGAGDAYLAGWAVHEDLAKANAWAALSCTKRGTELSRLDELDKLIGD